MKNFKKIFALILTVILAITMTMPAFADEPTTGKVIINGTTNGHQWDAYQLFSGTVKTDPDSGEHTLTDIQWGSSMTSDGKIALGGDAAALADALKGLDAVDLIKFYGGSKSVVVNGTPCTFNLSYLQSDPVASVTVNNGSDGRIGDASAIFENLPQGYYFFDDNSSKPDTKIEGDAYSNPLVRVVGAGTMEVALSGTQEIKIGYPTLTKKVKENNGYTGNNNGFAFGNGYNDVADYNVGDAVPFRLVAGLPSNLTDYRHTNGGFGYSLTFTDTYSEGLNKPVITDIYALNANGLKVEIPVELRKIEYNESARTFSVIFADILQVDSSNSTLISGIDNTYKIVVDYTAVLNEKANVGNVGNENKAKITYSNDPRLESSKGNSPEDKVVVYTYQVEILKQNAQLNSSNGHTPLQGAKFTLQKASGTEDTTGNYVKTVDGTTGKVTEWTADVSKAYKFTSDNNGMIKVLGLDAGYYCMTETDAPSGYSVLTTPFWFDIVPSTSSGTGHPGIFTDSYTGTTVINNIKTSTSGNAAASAKTLVANAANGTGDATTGLVSLIVNNTSTAQLPVTGGMGTTLFYIVGAILVIGAGVILITRKRMNIEK